MFIKNYKLYFLFIIAYLTILNLKSINSFTIGKRRPYKENEGLYNRSDKVNELYEHDYKCNVYGNPKVRVIEFYYSWCGFCQKFAPIYKSLAENISGEFFFL